MTATTKEDPVVSEVSSTLREWHQIWLSLYLDNQVDLFERVAALLLELIESRNDLMRLLKPCGSNLNGQEPFNMEQMINEVKTNIVDKIDLGNRSLALDLVLRDRDFKPVDPVKLSPIKLYQLHADSINEATTLTNNAYGQASGYQESISSIAGSSIYSASQSELESDQYSTTSFRNQSSHHLQLALQQHKLISLHRDELLEVYICVVEIDSTSSSTIQVLHVTEKFLIKIKNDEVVGGLLNTVFTNIGSIQGKELAILIQVYRVGKMTLVDGFKTSFGKQQSNSNLPSSIYSDLSNAGPFNNSKLLADLPRSRHSTIVGGLNLQPNYRRPFGATFLLLNNRNKGIGQFKEFNMSTKIFATQNEMEFTSFNDLYTKKSQFKINQYTANIQLDLSMKFLIGSFESIPRLTTFSCNDYCLTEKRGFPDVVMPGDFKNDLYLTLENAEFEKGGKSISKNIEASISLIDRSGLVIEKCIVPASNCDKVSCYKSCIFYHSNTPRWNECVKINVPLTEFDKAHIRIEFRHCSTKDRDKKFLGFSFLPLSDEEGTVIPDETHELYLYKCDLQSFEEDSTNLCKYTSLPYGPSSKITRLNNNNSTSGSKQYLNQNYFTHSSKEVVTVSTFLLSTKLTQNSTLLNLLKWRELVKRNNQDFEDTLNKVLVLKGEEIVKFLQDILDTLFDTFTLYMTVENSCFALIFKVLVHIFLLLDDPKYQHFKTVLDTYASAHFSATLVYKGLLACVKKCVDSVIVERHALLQPIQPIQRCFKSIKYLFQFIVQSKILYSKATGEQNDEQFLEDLRHLFKLLETMLSSDDKKLIPLQETFLESFPGAIEQLMRVMNSQELVQVVTSLPGSVGFHLPPQLSKAKLIFMREAATSSLLLSQENRMQISEIFCRHIEIYITNTERLELCHEVTEILLLKIHDNHWPKIHSMYLTSSLYNERDTQVMSIGEISMYSKSGKIPGNQLDLALINVARELEPFVKLMNPLLRLLDKLVMDLNNDRPIIQRYCNCLLTILKLMGTLSFRQFVTSRQIDYLALCELFKSLRAVYYRDWSIMQLTSHAILEHPIDEMSKIEFENQQPSSYIHLIVDFITHPTLQLESFSERKKKYVLSVFGDLRLKFSTQLVKFWQNLSKSKISELIPTSLQSFLDAAMLPNDDLQRKLIPLFYDMMEADDQTKSNLRQMERCSIDHLDLFMNLDRGNAKFVKNFEILLTDLIEAKSPSWKIQGLKLVSSFTRLMNLLMNYRRSLEIFDGRSRQMICLVELLNFYKDQDRIDIYLKYLFKLCDIHLDSGYHTEAAFTLKLYADELRWSNRNLSALEGFRPDEQEWKRKEVLFHRIIHYFDLGKCWEESISLCKELASFYENFLVDYEKVSITLKKLAQLLDKILTEHRPEREYFRVEFVGSDQPEFVRDKELIYRGFEYERLAAFIQRILSQFPNARVLSVKEKKTLFGEDGGKSNNFSGQFVVISNVKPVPFLQDTFKTGHRIINDRIIQYYLNNRLDTFSYDLPLVKGASKDKSGDINMRNLWVGRCILKLQKQLPDILPWSEVMSQEYIEISPLTNAIETISSMNVELSKLILSYTKEPSKQLSPLTMRLQGVLEAAVNGGPSVIINAFFKRQPLESTDQAPNDQELLLKLKNLLKQQFKLLETGLGLHSKLAPPEVMPLHNRLVECLKILRKSFIEETTQVENNYETLYNVTVNRNTDKSTIPIVNQGLTSDSSLCSSNGSDETDGHTNNKQLQEENGNVCASDRDDQIYSLPCEALGSPMQSIVHSEGTKSETNSPSGNLNNVNSSLSTLAIFGNKPLNRRARISMTPSKEMYSTLYRGNDCPPHSDSSELKSKAARRLTYDSSKFTIETSKYMTTNYQKPLGSITVPKQPDLPPTSNDNATSSGSRLNLQGAPPLPPRLLQDRHQVNPQPLTTEQLKTQSNNSQHIEFPSVPPKTMNQTNLIISQQRATTNNLL